MPPCSKIFEMVDMMEKKRADLPDGHHLKKEKPVDPPPNDVKLLIPKQLDFTEDDFI